MLRENINGFEFQGRTVLAPNSDATIFSAFAMRNGNDIVEVNKYSISMTHIKAKSVIIFMIKRNRDQPLQQK